MQTARVADKIGSNGLRWLSLAVLAAAGVVLALAWSHVPDRWAVHWGAGDRPNGWVSKSPAAALAPLGFGFVLWLFIELVVAWMRRQGARTTPAVPAPYIEVQIGVARFAALGIALLTGGMAVILPLVHPRSSIPVVAGAFLDIGLVILVGLKRASAQTRALRAAGVALPDGYHGAIYRNPQDARLWVPKLMGMGWTINFAHRRAWPALLALVLGPILLVLAIIFFASRAGTPRAHASDDASDDDTGQIIGRPAPPFEVSQWFNSRPLAVEDLRGKVVLVRWFMSANCPLCSATAPSLNRLWSAYKDRGLVVVGMYHHKDPEPLDPELVRRTAAGFGFSFPIAIDADWRTLERWWLAGHHRRYTSVSFLLDRKGIVRHIHRGGKYAPDSADFKTMKKKIEELLALRVGSDRDPTPLRARDRCQRP